MHLSIGICGNLISPHGSHDLVEFSESSSTGILDPFLGIPVVQGFANRGLSRIPARVDYGSDFYEIGASLESRARARAPARAGAVATRTQLNIQAASG